MPTAPAVNSYQGAARLQKASALAAELHKAGVLSSDIPQITPNYWSAISKSLGINPPSAETIESVTNLLRNLEVTAQRDAEIRASVREQVKTTPTRVMNPWQWLEFAQQHARWAQQTDDAAKQLDHIRWARQALDEAQNLIGPLPEQAA